MLPPFQWHLFFLFYLFCSNFGGTLLRFPKASIFGKELLPNLATVLTVGRQKRLARREVLGMLWEGCLLSLHPKTKEWSKMLDVGITDLFKSEIPKKSEHSWGKQCLVSILYQLKQKRLSKSCYKISPRCFIDFCQMISL